MIPNISNQLGAQQSQESLDGCDVRIYLSFEKIIRLDVLSESDPYAEVALVTGKQRTELGKTETINNKSTGQWTTSFTFRYLFEARQFLHVKVFDKDVGKDDFVGHAAFSVGNTMSTPADGVISELVLISTPNKPSRGYVVLRAEKVSENGFGIGGKIDLKLSGHRLYTNDWGGLLNSNPYYVLIKKIRDDWVPIHRSEYVAKTKNPKWNAANLSLDKLCNGDLPREFLIRVYDHGRSSNSEFIGEAKVSVNDLVKANKNKTHIEIKHPPTKSKYRKSSYRNSGTITVDYCRCYQTL